MVRLPRNTFQSSSDRRWSFIFLFVAAIIFFVFVYFGEPERGLLAACTSAVLATVLYVRWELRRKMYLWVFLFIFLIFHVAVIYNVHLGVIRFPVVTLVPVATLDVIVALSLLTVIEKCVGGPEK